MSREGSFDKPYDKLCQIPNIGQFKPPSRIRQQLEPSPGELVAHGYLERWDLQKTVDGTNFRSPSSTGPSSSAIARIALRLKPPFSLRKSPDWIPPSPATRLGTRPKPKVRWGS
jgi:hypothetical protein